MVRWPSYGAVILAAGESSRMGSDKALLPWPPQTGDRPPSNETFLSAAIRSLEFSTDFVIVVAGGNEAALSPLVYAVGASIVTNPEPSRGQFSSLQIGLNEVLNRGRDAAIITLVDRPPARRATIEQLRAAFTNAPDGVWAVVPEYAGQHGHPYVAGREMMTIFLDAPPTASARDIEHTHQQQVQYVPVDDPFVAMNVNTPEDYAELAAAVTHTRERIRQIEAKAPSKLRRPPG
jgi:molybdenum cofactor cytidylyltransferase